MKTDTSAIAPYWIALKKRQNGDQLLNFLAFGTFSPDSNLSAPTFLPLLGQPVLLEQEDCEIVKMTKNAAMVRLCFFMITI